MIRKKIVEAYTGLVVKVALKVAEVEANTTCPYIGFQAEMPNLVKKMSKIKDEENLH